MRNLNLIGVSENNYFVLPGTPEICCFAEGVFYFITKSNIYCVRSSHVTQVCELNVEDRSSPVFLDSAEYGSHLVTCMSTGEILLYNGQIEVVGNVDPGILAAQWSPAQDLLAVVASSYNLVLLGQDLDPVYECELQGSAGEMLVSVGWGKAETQFRGSAGKFKNESQEYVKAHDDGKVRVSWRGDGQLVAVSFPDQKGRQIKVVNNEGRLLYHLEAINGLESSLCWKPSGALIASTLQLPNKHIVAFFEKNLLRHGGFELPDKCVVNELLWNPDSTVLAVTIDKNTEVMLFSVNNYHWYHKYTVQVPKEESVVYLSWDKDDANSLIAFTTKDSTIKQYRWSWRWSVLVSSGDSNDDQAWAAVIDGKQLLLTSFRRGIVPPPMSSATLQADEEINSVGFLQCGAGNNSNDFFLQTVSNKIIIYRYCAEKNTHTPCESFRFQKDSFQVSWVSSDMFFACGVGKDRKNLLCYNLQTKEIKTKPLGAAFTIAQRFPNEEKVLLWQGESMTIVDLLGNELATENTKTKSTVMSLEVRENTVFVLDSSFCLKIAGSPLAKNITSFSVTPTHLLATTMQHKLNCWRLDHLDEAPVERSVERGAKIITHISGTSSVVLQLPRGNLEVIQPRPLTIAILHKLLDSCEYRKAFLIMRRERINLNLLCDHDISKFENNIAHFVSDVADPIYLCNFIADISNDDTTKSLYSSFYTVRPDLSGNKVDKLCGLMLTELADPKLFLPKLSCLVRTNDIEKALLLIKDAREKEQAGEALAVSSSEGLSHILYLVDVEELFKIALGTYDLSLVMYIASKSQKDPKEYVPFLANLQKMDECYQKFSIDNYLKRYKKALHHLAASHTRVKECLDYVQKHGLFREALQLFAPRTDTWKSASVLYGAELTRLGKHEEAGVILERAGETVLAEHAYARAGAWKRRLRCILTQTTAEDEKDALFRSIADSLRTARRYKELAQFCFDHCGDTAGGVEALLACQEFDEAIRQANLRGSAELIESKVRPAAVTSVGEIQDTLANSVLEISTTLSRLEVIKEAARLGEPTADFDDTASESSRGSSRLSSRSAKNTRKLERNLMKKGGRFESVALTALLHDVATRVASLKGPIYSLNMTLVLLDEECIARELQRAFKDALQKVESMVKMVWQQVVTEEQQATSSSAATAFTCGVRQLPEPVKVLQPKVLFAPELGSVEWQLHLLDSANTNAA